MCQTTHCKAQEEPGLKNRTPTTKLIVKPIAKPTTNVGRCQTLLEKSCRRLRQNYDVFLFVGCTFLLSCLQKKKNLPLMFVSWHRLPPLSQSPFFFQIKPKRRRFK